MLKRHFIAMDGPKVIGIFRLSAEKDKCEVSRDDDFDLDDHRHHGHRDDDYDYDLGGEAAD